MIMNPKMLMPLNDEQLHLRAPSIFAERPYGKVSDRYRQVQTIEVVNIMRDQGWMPVLAQEKRAVVPEKRGYTKHMIRFQRADNQTVSQVGDEFLQAVLTNSHDRSSCFIFQLGIFRLVCSNGLVVGRGMFNEIHIRHVGFNPRDVVQASARIGEGGKLVGENIQVMKALPVGMDERMALARAVVPLVLDTEGDADVVNPYEFLRTRRSGDTTDNLWGAFNTIQENVTKGGVPYYRQDPDGGVKLGRCDLRPGRRVIPRRYNQVRTRPVKSIDRDLRLNQSLWTLAEEMRKLKTAKA